MTTDSRAGWRKDPYGVERWWDGRKWQEARDRKHDLVAGPRVATAPSGPIMPAASFTRPPVVKSPSPYARPTAPPLYFPPSQPQVHVPAGKRLGVALTLALLFGVLGIHRIYLDRTASGILMLLVAIANAVTIVVAGLLPVVGLAVLGLWWLTDLFRIRRMVRAANARRFA